MGFIYPDFNANNNGPLFSDLDKVIGNFNALFSINSNFYLPYYFYRLLLILGVDINNNFESTETITLGIEVNLLPISILVLAILFIYILIYHSLIIPIMVIGHY